MSPFALIVHVPASVNKPNSFRAMPYPLTEKSLENVIIAVPALSPEMVTCQVPTGESGLPCTTTGSANHAPQSRAQIRNDILITSSLLLRTSPSECVTSFEFSGNRKNGERAV